MGSGLSMDVAYVALARLKYFGGHFSEKYQLSASPLGITVSSVYGSYVGGGGESGASLCQKILEQKLPQKCFKMV